MILQRSFRPLLGLPICETRTNHDIRQRRDTNTNNHESTTTTDTHTSYPSPQQLYANRLCSLTWHEPRGRSCSCHIQFPYDRPISILFERCSRIAVWRYLIFYKSNFMSSTAITVLAWPAPLIAPLRSSATSLQHGIHHWVTASPSDLWSLR